MRLRFLAATPLVLLLAIGGAAAQAYADEPAAPAKCSEEASAIGSVQGPGSETPIANQTTTVQGVVTADLTAGGFRGFYVQDEGDGYEATSDGIFIYAPNGPAVRQGDELRITGRAGEYQGQTQISAQSWVTCARGVAVPEPTRVTLPRESADSFERFEGMSVIFDQALSINEYFNFGRYGELALGSKRQYQPTQLYAPGSPKATALEAANALDRIVLDDARSVQNPDPARHPDGTTFTADHRFRGGDTLTGVVGIMDFRFGSWRIQPTAGASYTERNPRPGAPEVGGRLQVATMNVLNYFTTLNRRGAKTQAELERQEAKIVAALNEMDADVVGLLEIENNDGVALKTLTEALNDDAGERRWAAIETGTVGTDEITTALIYDPAILAPVGRHAILDSSVDPRFIDTLNRPVIAQTFKQRATGKNFTVAVNHLKSKGSDCDDVGDPEDPNGQGNCNGTRTRAAQAEADWLASDPTGTGATFQLAIGDFNAYNKEDPIAALQQAGFTDTVPWLGGNKEYGYVFDGELGSLDHILVNDQLRRHVSGAVDWHINADEPSILDYTTTFKKPAQQALYRPDVYRSSDHDPVVVGLDLERRQVHRPRPRS